MRTITAEDITVKGIRKAMRALKKEENGSELVRLLVPGWGQIECCGGGAAPYAVGPLPENDDTDVYHDYSAWTYGCKESWILDWIKQELGIE